MSMHNFLVGKNNKSSWHFSSVLEGVVFILIENKCFRFQNPISIQANDAATHSILLDLQV